MDCTFEDGWCNYFHDPTGDFEWERTNIATPSSNTGPGFGMFQISSLFSFLPQMFSHIYLSNILDHTTGSGYYAFIESSYPR